MTTNNSKLARLTPITKILILLIPEHYQIQKVEASDIVHDFTSSLTRDDPITFLQHNTFKLIINNTKQCFACRLGDKMVASKNLTPTSSINKFMRWTLSRHLFAVVIFIKFW